MAEIGQKRFREDEVVEPEWTEEELEQLQSVGHREQVSRFHYHQSTSIRR